MHDAAAWTNRITMHAAKSVGSDRRTRTHPSESSSVTPHRRRPAMTRPHPTVEATAAPAVSAAPVSTTPALREGCGCAVEQQGCTAYCHQHS